MGLFETLEYKVIKKVKRIEVRNYKNFNLATTKTVLDKQQSSGFNNVFDYISGSNESNEKISMTVPVISRQVDNQLLTGFVVPKKYDAGSIPKPSSNKVQIEEYEDGMFIAIRFRGRWLDRIFDKYDVIVKDFIEKNDYEILSDRFILRYQPPIAPPFLRRNEVMYKVQKKKS